MNQLSPEQKQEDRTERTALANDRTLLASERTLAAWWRTALAALAASIGFFKLFENAERIIVVRIVASLPLLLALLILFVAFRRYSTTAHAIESESVNRVPRVELWIGTGLLGLLALGAGGAVWGLI